MNYQKICEEYKLSTLRDADLSHADLRNADLWSANLSGANLSGTDLSDADLSGTDLSDADLRNANLWYADLRNADLWSANLSGANLSGANLSGANLSGANLSGANLSGANLWSANLSGANLKGAIELGEISEEAIALVMKIADIVLSDPKKIEMKNVHTCETTHCLAGWVCTLSPIAASLEKILGWNAAACIAVPIPAFTKNFYSTNEEAIDFLKEVVETNGASLRQENE